MYNYRGLFNFLCNGNSAISRFGYKINESKGKFYFNLPQASSYYDWYESFKNADRLGWSESGYSKWNQVVPSQFPCDQVVYLTMVFDGCNELECLYLNGEINESVAIDGSYWEGFLENFDENNIDSILLGAGTFTYTYWWHLSEMSCFAIRLYSRALSDQEVLENYNITVSYHDFLEKGGNSVVGND